MRIVIISACLMMLLSSCASNTKLLETCYQTAETYGDAVECVVKFRDKQ
jgi:hypothetical protein